MHSSFLNPLFARNSRYGRPREFIHAAETQKGEQKLREFSKYLSPSKLLKKQKWIDNWRAGPPPDWTCKGCSLVAVSFFVEPWLGWDIGPLGSLGSLAPNLGRGGYHNFGRNKICKTCDTKRPPREEWPEEKVGPPREYPLSSKHRSP